MTVVSPDAWRRPAPFDIRDPLPGGFTVREASAGTGKTWSLAGLVTRFVAEQGLAASELCIVSFTEAATAELRGRIRDRLAGASAHLAAGAPEAAAAGDPVLQAVGADPERWWERRDRLEAALADFDAASISTIHGFCSRIVPDDGALGAITADDTDVDEVVADVLLARYGADGSWKAEPHKVAQVVRLRLQLPDAAMFTVDRSEVSLSAAQAARADDLDEIAELVEHIVTTVHEQRRLTRRRTFDGLLTAARDQLRGPAGEASRAALRARFRLVLIDEFQDTDQVQWDIFRTAFLDGADPTPVVVVADPKQSIYRFRAAELSAYLEARRRADVVTSLDTNWRSDAPLLEGLDDLFGGYTFGDEQVRFQPVHAAEGRDEVCLRWRADGRPLDPAVSIRCLPEELSTLEGRVHAAADLVAEVVRLLEGVELVGDDGSARPLEASDIGVLVRSNADATRYVARLAAAGVPAASSSNDSVLESAAADQWRILLAALERPSSPARSRAAALGWFVGTTAAELDTMGEDGAGELAELLRGWAGALAEGGLARLMAEVRAAGLLGRVLRHPGGERDLTDLDHVLELMQTVVGGRPVGAAGLLAVLDDLADPDPDPHDEEALAPELLSRRIDRDDDTVKVLTVHRAKGLEFPVVLCPTLWTQRPNRQGLPHAHTPAGRVIDTNAMRGRAGEGGKPYTSLPDADTAERHGEDARLLYVALTRARHRLVVWWKPIGTKVSPLGHLLASAGGGEPDLDALGSAVEVVPAGPGGRAPVLARPSAEPPELGVATARRHFDDRWRIWSFSSMKAAGEAAAAIGVAAGTGPGGGFGGGFGGRELTEAPPMGGVDEPALPSEGPAEHAAEGLEPAAVLASGSAVAPAPDQSGLLGEVGGTSFGTVVHAVLERVDFAAADVAGQLRERAAELLAHRKLATTPDLVADGLLRALRAPLGGAMGTRALVDLERRDRLDELGFDLPLAGIAAAELADVVLGHLDPGDPLRPWFADAASGALAVDVAGMLTGSIDLVARTPEGRYWLADYKTNRVAEGYGPDALAHAMVHHGYALQATLYLAALHRYLRWRVRGYDPDLHLDGAAYLFLRGMTGATGDGDGSEAVDQAGGERGVIWWRPPTAAIEAVDRVLATGRVA